MLLFNPSEKRKEFRFDGKPVYIDPFEVRELPDYLAKHALRSNVGLVEHDPRVDNPESLDLDYKTMPWRKVISLASKRGIFKMGMKKAELLKLMEEYDQSTGGTLSEPSSEKEGAGV